jgi:hypothetical protein
MSSSRLVRALLEKGSPQHIINGTNRHKYRLVLSIASCVLDATGVIHLFRRKDMTT